MDTILYVHCNGIQISRLIRQENLKRHTDRSYILWHLNIFISKKRNRKMGFTMKDGNENSIHFLKREMVSKVLWEPHILSRYRKTNQPWSYYLKSLFWIHNETGNIWTHLLSPALIAGQLYTMRRDVDFSNNASTHGLLIFTVSSCMLTLISAVAHLFRSKSVMLNYIMFSLDYAAIGLFSFGQGTILFYCSGNKLFYTVFGSSYPVLNWVFALNITACVTIGGTLYSHNNKMKKIFQQSSVFLGFLFGQIPIYCRLFACIIQNNCLVDHNAYHISTTVCATLAGIFFGTHMPEGFCPGKFDIWGHSHQLFHIMVSMGCFFLLKACCVDLTSTSKDILDLARPNVFNMWHELLVFTFLNVVTIVIILCKFKHIIDDKNKRTICYRNGHTYKNKHKMI